MKAKGKGDIGRIEHLNYKVGLHIFAENIFYSLLISESSFE